MIQIHLQSANGNLARAFPQLVRLCLKKCARGTYKRDIRILTRRSGLDGGPINTLEELGAVHEITRERVRQLQAQSEKRIRQLLEGTLKRKGWDIDESLRQGFAQIREELDTEAPCLSRTRFQTVVRPRFGNGIPAHWFELFATIAGYRVLQPTGQITVPDLKERWIPAGALPQKTINQVFRALIQLHKRVEGRPFATLLVNLRANVHPEFSEAQLKAFIAACPRLQVTRGEVVRVRMEWLSSAADQAWRVLESTGRLLDRGEIARRVNAVRVGKRELTPMPIESVATQISGDGRFACSGKSGLWGLTSWGTINEMTIVEAMEQALHTAGHPITVKELIRATGKLRPDASKKSIRSYVNQRRDLFVSAGVGKVALRSWRLNLPQTSRKNPARCGAADFVAAIELARDGRDEMPLAELVETVVDLTGQAEGTVRQRIHVLDGVKLEPMKRGRGKWVMFTGRRVEAPSEAGPTKRERIQKTIKTMIEEEGLEFKRKKDLHEALIHKLPCKRTTFYRYFSEMAANKNQHIRAHQIIQL